VDPKNSLTNKNRYIVASQDLEVRAHMRKIAGVPLIYISKSIMLLEPMAALSETQREREEVSKFRQGLKGQRKPDVAAAQKRKREDNEGTNDASIEDTTADARPQKKKKQRGPKQPNPLSMKKSVKAPPKDSTSRPRTVDSQISQPSTTDVPETSAPEGEAGHRKRKRKPKSKGEGLVMADVEEVAVA
jgi:U3 small nucleolar RNA-associated protein 23